MHLKGISLVHVLQVQILISLCCRMDKHIKGWFTEMNDMWPGQAMAMQVEEILHHEKSQYQDILVFKRYVCMRVCICACVCGWFNDMWQDRLCPCKWGQDSEVTIPGYSHLPLVCVRESFPITYLGIG